MSRIEPTGSDVRSLSATYPAAPGTLTVTFPLRTSTLTLWPRTGGATAVPDPAVAGEGGAPPATAAAGVLKGTSSPRAKPWWLKATRRTW